jgi:hypothetical protein
MPKNSQFIPAPALPPKNRKLVLTPPATPNQATNPKSFNEEFEKQHSPKSDATVVLRKKPEPEPEPDPEPEVRFQTMN